MLFTVKICGITTPGDAALAAAAGADAIGLNFVAGSPRALGIDAARAVAGAVPPRVLKVGVFAGATAAEIRAIAEAVGLDAVQLHGHLAGEGPGVDPPTRCAELAGLTLIRAVRLEAVGQASRLSTNSPDALDPLAAARRWLAEATALNAAPDFVIVDAPVTRETAPGQLGGTGATVDWASLAAALPLGPPMALAGGLTPDNVAAAIHASMAAAVDTASGVESAPGCKDPGKVRAFVANARTALEATAKRR